MKESKTVRVEGVLVAGHKGPAVELSFDPEAELGVAQTTLEPGRGYPVEVLLGRVRFRSAIVPRNRRLFLLVDESLAKRAGAKVGETVSLTLWADVARA